MLQLLVKSAEGNKGTAEMFIDYLDEYVEITVIHNKNQFDFSIDKNEWEQINAFINAKAESTNYK